MAEHTTSSAPTHHRLRTLGYRLRAVGAILLLVLLLGSYATTLQTHISGGFSRDTLKNEYIKDVSEIQVALNIWGTIHHTGYPAFTILGNLFAAPLRLLGVEPAFAASLYALAWGMVALASVGLLVWALTGRPALAGVSVALLGVTRSIWIHNVVAEVYSMSLAITALMLLVVLWPVPWRGAWSTPRRVAWLALLGGIGVAHHRAVAFVAPGLIAAVVPHLWRERRRWPVLLPVALGLALIGFVPYVYLPLRAWHGGAWVYGEPGTWAGFWTEFTGREAERLVTLPDDAAGWWDNARAVWDILAAELTLPGLLAGLAGLIAAMIAVPQRYAVRIVALCAAGPALFAVAFHTAVLPEAILMPVVLALVLGMALAIDTLLRRRAWIAVAGQIAVLGLVGWTAALVGTHHPYVRELVTEPGGLHTIERLKRVPRTGDPVYMLPWGPRHAAAAYSSLVTGENGDVQVVDHKADYARLLDSGHQLYTEWETFYTYPLPWPTALVPAPEPADWWLDRLDWDVRLGKFHLTSAAPGIVQLSNRIPALAEPDGPDGARDAELLRRYNISRQRAWLTCDDEAIYLHVIWQANAVPTGDLAIFVHLTGDEPAPNPPNADSRYPVYGLYPFTEWWGPAQLVRDDFTLPRVPGKTQVRFGLYEPDNPAAKIGERVLPVAGCVPVAWAGR